MLDFLFDGSVQTAFARGLLTTLALSVTASVLALFIGMSITFARVSQVSIFEKLAAAFVALFRNTPLLIQLLFYYRGLQSIGIMLPPFLCGVLALSLYTAAYLAEVFRSGLLAIPNEQREAGLSLGLGRWGVYRQILIPQALRIVMPAVGNQLISLTKNSSLVAFITVTDLFYVIYKGAVDHFLPMEYFIEGGIIYLAMSLGISALIRVIERALNRPDDSRTSGAAAHA